MHANSRTMTAAGNRVAAVTIEYDDGKGGRAAKEFAAVGASRSFYAKKMREGKNPKVVGAKKECEGQAGQGA